MEGKILVVDDERKIVQLVKTYLEASGFLVFPAYTGPEAIQAFRHHEPDLVVLDLMLPGMDGLQVLGQIRRVSSVPVILLTARSEESDKISGLEVGADDYVVKPFSPKELTARVRAVLRRTKTELGLQHDLNRTSVQVGELKLDRSLRIARWAGHELELTTFQFELLYMMASSPGRVFTRLQLVENIQGGSGDGYERTIDAHMKNLRKALGDDARNPQILITVRGVGYKFNAPSSSP